MITIVKRGVSFFYAFIFVYFIYSFCILLLKIGLDGASGNIFFVTLSIFLCGPFIKYNKMKSDITNGFIEENYKVNREIGKLKDNFNIMEGLILKDGDDNFKIENIVITNKGVFNIVKCNYKGEFHINKYNKWYKTSRKGNRGVISPITEVRKNRDYLIKLFDEDLIIDLIVMVNDRVYIEGEENSDVPIIRYDELFNYIADYPIDKEIDSDELYDKLFKKLIESKDIHKEEILYNKFVDNIWAFRSRLIFISAFFIVYILNIIYMQRT
ncbi:NERD domain-containing protein [Clostridium sp. SHJSY1]|uniref:nuclease-related domain-containing protein n=1 Tax=Clostridium sp. SHJSY1 TaxID=2942483 RepID=UPI002875075A|nr:nuclease-related domain-containing protein [Clostridium sp. SHJSY1]MDS0525733.1 NERD domain-containing protein [Clostridium sp. SHJSY1]